MGTNELPPVDAPTGAEPVAETAPVTPSPAPAGEGDDYRRKFETLLGEKSSWERDRQELERLRDETNQLRGGYNHATDTDAGNPRLKAWNDGIRMWQDAAAKGDPSAQVFLEALGMLNTIPREFSTRLALTEIPGDERKDVERIMEERRQRGEVISPATAREIRAAAKLADREAALAAREAAVKRFEQDRENGVVVTNRVPAPPRSPGNGTMTFSEYGRAMDNAKTDEERDKLRADRKSGALKLSPG